MNVTLNLPAPVGERVQREAARQALPVEEFLLGLVARALPESEEAARRERSLSLLEEMEAIGDEAEQRRTFEELRAAVDEDRLSRRNRF